MIGRTLSHYRITAALGAGGMGEVYRATDTTLGREVAVKVLPRVVADDPERLARFKREAQLLASLNHPNIGAIYGLEQIEGTPLLILELVEGDDLSHRLARGPIPVAEAIEIAEQIAEALEEAHAKGIVHRDLKPANIKLTAAGKVKVLDFGLAKAWAGEVGEAGSAPALSRSPTLAPSGTMAGVILGTAAYMSPEQARGRPVDRRADIWAFGVVLWEMLTGRMLFRGDTVTDVIAAVVTKDPDLDPLPADTPPAVRRLISRCLRRDPRTRLPDIGGARIELQDVRAGIPIDGDSPAASPERGARGGRLRTWVPWTIAAVTVVTAAVALASTWRSDGPPVLLPARFTTEVPDPWQFVGYGWPEVAPDGRSLVFSAVRASAPQAEPRLWLRALDAVTPRELAGTDGAITGFWSPDGRQIAFMAGGELRKLTLADGSVQRICALPGAAETGVDGDWSPDGTIIFVAGTGPGSLHTVPAAGGTSKPFLAPDPKTREDGFVYPQFLPDGRRFLALVVSQRQGAGGIYVMSLDRPGERRLLLQDSLRLIRAGDHVLFVRGGTLLAQPFDAARAELHGEPVAIASDVGFWSEVPGVAWFGASPRETLAYFSHPHVTGRLQLAWVDRTGKPLANIGTPELFGQLALSPDARHLAVEILSPEGQHDLWVMDVARGVLSRVTATPGNERDPVWARDGRSLVFIARRDQGVDMRRKALRASDPETVLLDSPDEEIPESWGPDADLLFYIRRNEAGQQRGHVLNLSDGKDESLVATDQTVDELHLSPDGGWLAYVSAESGREEVYVEPFRREGERVRVSVNGGGQPKWRADGRELFFVGGGRELMAVQVQADGQRLAVSLPVRLFDLRAIQGLRLDDYAAAPDGQRFLVKLPLDETARLTLQIVTNWTSLISRAR